MSVEVKKPIILIYETFPKLTQVFVVEPDAAIYDDLLKCDGSYANGDVEYWDAIDRVTAWHKGTRDGANLIGDGNCMWMVDPYLLYREFPPLPIGAILVHTGFII